LLENNAPLTIIDKIILKEKRTIMKKLLAFLAVLACFYIIAMGLQRVSWFPLGSKETQAASMRNINVIDIHASAADVSVIPDNREDVKAEYKGKGKLKVTKSGDTIKVSLERSWFEGINFFDKKKLKIYIPKDFNEKMAVNIGSGRLHFSGPSKSKPMNLNELSLDMSSGMVDLENLKVGSYRHVGSSGNAQLNYVTAGNATIKMSSGNVDLSHFQGKLSAKLSSGRFKGQLDQLKDSIDVKISSGIVSLDLPKNSDFTLEGKVSSGLISCDFPLESRSSNGHSISGTYGTGKYKVNVTASSGKVNIY